MLILLGGIWKFWPDATRQPTQTLPVNLGAELGPWFQSARLSEAQPSRFTVELALNPGYRSTLQNSSHIVQLGYQILGENGTLYQGVAPCALDGNQPHTLVALPNPKRVTGRGLHLYLAR